MNYKASLSEIEACLQNNTWRGTFSDEIEAKYIYYMRSQKERSFDHLILPILLIYNLFLLADIFLLPGTWKISLALHLCVSLAMAIVWFAYKKVESNLVRAFMEASIPLMMVAQIMTIYVSNTGEAAGHYQYFAVMVLIFANVNIRLQHSVALWVTLFIVALYVSAMWAGQAALPFKVAGTFTMVGVAYATLKANRHFSWDSRYAFLRQVQDSLRYENAEAKAMNDSLTGLKNRRYLEEYGQQDLPYIGAAERPLGAIMVDIDHFKDYNDEYGHQAGDECIRLVASALCASVRGEQDLAIRYGGEEFLVLLPGADMESTVKTAERIRRAVLMMQVPHCKNSASLNVTVSLGACSGPSSPSALPMLIAVADSALYMAKNEGRNRVCRSDLGDKGVNVA